MRKLTYTTLMVLCTATILCGCGKKGPQSTYEGYYQPKPAETLYREVDDLDDLAVDIDDIALDSKKAGSLNDVKVRDANKVAKDAKKVAKDAKKAKDVDDVVNKEPKINVIH